MKQHTLANEERRKTWFRADTIKEKQKKNEKWLKRNENEREKWRGEKNRAFKSIQK